MKRLWWCWILVMLWSASCRKADPDQAAEQITSQALMRDITALSADDMEGRKAGTEGERKAADYIAERFRQIGLSPLSESYFQPVRLIGSHKVASQSFLRIRGPRGELPFESDQTLTYWSSSQKPVVEIANAPIVFVGYGVEAPEHGWDDFKGADLNGKILLFLNDDPPVVEEGVALFGGEARTYYGRWTYKFEQAMRKGAAGAIMIHTTDSASYPFSVVQHSGAEERLALDLPGTGYQVDLLAWVDEATSRLIAASMGTTLEELFERAADRAFQPADTGFSAEARIETEIRKVEARNVVGYLEGSDSELRQEFLVFSAHYDHLGVAGEQAEGDRIYNGAWDNAAGTASLLSLAEAAAKLSPPPRRSLLFLACTAEESGSLGSQWLVSQPPAPLERRQLVGNFNIDMPQIFGLTADIAAIGVDTNSLGEAFQSAAAQFEISGQDGKRSLRVVGDPDPKAGSFYRSDQVNFAKAGIPALYLRPGRDYVEPLSFDPQEYREKHYHQVSDEVNEQWNLAGLERDLRVIFEAARRTAEADGMPRWNPGNEFEEEWKTLHGKP